MAPKNSPQSDAPICFLVRHGDVTLEDADIIVSRADLPLSSEGEQQTKAAIDFLADFDIKDVYSSPLIRCLTMAREFAGDREVKQERALLPWSRGILTGISKDAADPLIKLLLVNPTVVIPMGESRQECEERINEFFVPALDHAEVRTAVFFTHHTVIDFLSYLIAGERPDDPPNIVEVGGIAAVYVDGDGYRMEALLNASKTKTLDAVS